MSDEQQDQPTPNPDLHSVTDADQKPGEIDIPPTKENPGFTGAPQDLLGCTVTFKGSKTAAGIVTGWSHIQDKGLVVEVGGKEYLAADIIVVQPRG